MLSRKCNENITLATVLILFLSVIFTLIMTIIYVAAGIRGTTFECALDRATVHTVNITETDSAYVLTYRYRCSDDVGVKSVLVMYDEGTAREALASLESPIVCCVDPGVRWLKGTCDGHSGWTVLRVLVAVTAFCVVVAASWLACVSRCRWAIVRQCLLYMQNPQANPFPEPNWPQIWLVEKQQHLRRLYKKIN